MSELMGKIGQYLFIAEHFLDMSEFEDFASQCSSLHRQGELRLIVGNKILQCIKTIMYGIESRRSGIGFSLSSARRSSDPAQFLPIELFEFMDFDPLILFTDRLMFKIIGIVAGKNDDFSSMEFEDMRTYPFKEISIVCDHEQCDAMILEISFKPFYHIKIEMVGRFIEYQHLWIAHQGLYESDTFLLSSG